MIKNSQYFILQTCTIPLFRFIYILHYEIRYSLLIFYKYTNDITHFFLELIVTPDRYTVKSMQVKILLCMLLIYIHLCSRETILKKSNIVVLSFYIIV